MHRQEAGDRLGAGLFESEATVPESCRNKKGLPVPGGLLYVQ